MKCHGVVIPLSLARAAGLDSGTLDAGENAVPELEAGFDGLGSGVAGLGPELVVSAAEVLDHAERERAVILAVDFDVALEIPDEFGEIVFALVELADQGAEDGGDGVLAAEGEGGGESGQGGGADEGEGGFDEAAGLVGSAGRGAEGVHGGGWGDGGEERGDGGDVGAELLHGLDVELEVGDGAAGVEVGLFAEDDLVDEAAGLGEDGGRPGNGGTGEPRLQGLEEGHEVPDGEDVRLHEEAEVRGCADGGVERVRGEAGLERGEAGVKLVEVAGLGGSGGECAHRADYR